MLYIDLIWWNNHPVTAHEILDLNRCSKFKILSMPDLVMELIELMKGKYCVQGEILLGYDYEAWEEGLLVMKSPASQNYIIYSMPSSIMFILALV